MATERKLVTVLFCDLEFAATEFRVERSEMVVGYARFLAGQRRSAEARALLDEARALVDGTGAALVERLIREVEALALT